MITITIDGKKYKGVYSWDDLTIQRFSGLAAIPMPEGYKGYLLADGKFKVDEIEKYIEAVSNLTDEQINRIFPAYYRKVVSCLSNIPEIVEIDQDNVIRLYDWYFKPFVASLIYHIPVIHCMGSIKEYEPLIIRRFKSGMRTYYLPETVDIMGQSVPLANERIHTFCEASDIFRTIKFGADDIKRLALFMAIYCRRKNERYDERKTLARYDRFLKLPMSVVWAVFFCIIRRLPDYTLSIRLFGEIPRTLRETVSAAREYQSMEVEV